MEFARIIIRGTQRTGYDVALVEGGLKHLVPLLLRHEWRRDYGDWELFLDRERLASVLGVEYFVWYKL